MARVTVLVISLHVSQSQSVVELAVGSANPSRMKSVSFFHSAATAFYLLHNANIAEHLLLLELHVGTSPLDARPRIAHDEARHINVHPPGNHDRHTERYYGGWN